MAVDISTIDFADLKVELRSLLQQIKRFIVICEENTRRHTEEQAIVIIRAFIDTNRLLSKIKVDEFNSIINAANELGIRTMVYTQRGNRFYIDTRQEEQFVLVRDTYLFADDVYDSIGTTSTKHTFPFEH